MIELEIDGKKIGVPEGTTIIEASDKLGIYIPRFCYHKKLSIAANCRMCLIEVEKVGKPLPACATPVTPGMNVLTRSNKALQAQRAVMEYLLINHPLDCPICDQGGECELQDLSMGFGRGFSHYTEPKRAVFNEDIGPLIETEMTRCIHCTRCVRFGEEVAGLRELGATGRGENMEIGTYVKHFLQSELSANVIDLCPVGALTNKAAMYSGRGWEYREHPSIGPHDCVGANTFVHSRGRQYVPQRIVMRTVPRENETINETWISDRDRFSCHALYHDSRVFNPRVKRGSEWVTISWERAFQEISTRLSSLISAEGATQIAALASSNSTVEEFYLVQKLVRGLGSHHIDHRMRWQDFSDQNEFELYPSLGMRITDIDNLSALLLIGSNIRQEQPLLGIRIGKAINEGGQVFALNSIAYVSTFPITVKMTVSPQQMINRLAEIVKALLNLNKQSIPAFADIQPSKDAIRIAERFKAVDKCAVFLGTQALLHPEASKIRALAHLIHQLSGATIGLLTSGANSAGAWIAGAIPHRGSGGSRVSEPGLDAKALLTTDKRQAYLLLNIEPELDAAYPAAALSTLRAAQCVVCLSPFTSSVMESYADFILPITPYTESSGTFINVEGRWQSFDAVSVPEGESKPAWQVLRVLADQLRLDDFKYKTTHEICDELKREANESAVKVEGHPDVSGFSPHSDEMIRVADWPMVCVDNLVRRSSPLQATLSPTVASIGINKNMAKQLKLSMGDDVFAVQENSEVVLPLVIDNRLPDNVVYIPSGIPETSGFGTSLAPVTLKRRS